MAANPDLEIEKPEDWQQFRANDLDVVVDPMVFRTADVFLRGRTGATSTLTLRDSEEIWNALSGDIGSLMAFFDQIILADRLPLIDYGITFDSALGYDVPWICQVVNEAFEDRVLATVHVHGEVSQRAREAALAALPERPAASPELEETVRRQLGAFDYGWRPDLGSLGSLPESALVLARFLYGGLVFSAFAQMSGSSHVLQSKRSRLFTAMSIGAPSASEEHEQELVSELDRRIQANPQYTDVRLGSLPSFLPYLLLSTEPQTPFDLLRAAKGLRANSLVREYRAWRREFLRNWVDYGVIDESHEKDIKRVVLKLHERCKVDRNVDLELGVGAKADVKGVGVDAGIKIPVPIGRIWGWILEQLPGRRYLKMLTRLKVAEQRYAHVDRHLKTVWSNA